MCEGNTEGMWEKCGKDSLREDGLILGGGGRWGMKSGWKGKGGLKVARKDGIEVLAELMEKEGGRLNRNGDERLK